MRGRGRQGGASYGLVFLTGQMRVTRGCPIARAVPSPVIEQTSTTLLMVSGPYRLPAATPSRSRARLSALGTPSRSSTARRSARSASESTRAARAAARPGGRAGPSPPSSPRPRSRAGAGAARRTGARPARGSGPARAKSPPLASRYSSTDASGQKQASDEVKPTAPGREVRRDQVVADPAQPDQALLAQPLVDVLADAHEQPDVGAAVLERDQVRHRAGDLLGQLAA